MTFGVDWHSNARKFLRKLSPEISERIVRKIKDIQQDPFRYLEHYEGRNIYKFRVGDYRALIEVNFVKRILIVRVLDKRGRVYKR